MRFWALDPPDNQKLLAKRTEDVVRLKTVICPANSGHQQAGRRVGQLSVDLPRDFERDFIWTWHSDCLLTKRAVSALRKNRVTGFETLPVTARFRQSLLDPPELFELRVTGWAGIAPLSSGVRLVEHCEHCGLLVYSNFKDATQLIDLKLWDGSDFFMIWPLPRFIFLTERAKNVIERAGLEGAIFVPAEKLPASEHRHLSPGRLSYWMSKERAHELDELYGIE
jgi:hypothetical protein